MGILVEKLDMPRVSESALRELAVFHQVLQADDMPGDPPTPFEARVAKWQNVPIHYPENHWILRDQGEIVAVAETAYQLEQNLENGFCRIHVHPEKRGRGYARALAGPAFDELEQLGRHRVEAWIKQDEPAESFAGRLGLESVYGEKRSRLEISRLSHELMRSWVERAGDRAGDYELVDVPMPVPDELLAKFCEMTRIMNTAPREGLIEEDEIITPEIWRDIESSERAARCELHTLVAVQRSTGDFVGYTQILTQELEPDLAWQCDTGVHPDHRNKGLGRWLKAAMIEKIVADHPKVERVDTFNAGSNRPMLDINVAMGFKPIHLSNVWQGELATARRRLGV